jgi:type II secretory pathway component PulC
MYNLFQQVFIHFSITYVSLVSSCFAYVGCEQELQKYFYKVSSKTRSSVQVLRNGPHFKISVMSS